MVEVAGDIDDWERHLCAPLTGRKIICSFEVLAAMTRSVARFHRWGAQRPLLIADGVGTGPLPLEADAEIVVVEMPEFDSLTDQVRARMQPETRLTPDVVTRVEDYDPAGEAAWWVGPPTPNTPILGRSVLGGRPPSQAALEDKLLLDGLLEQVGAPRSPSVIAQASYDDLTSASQEVMSSTGVDEVVWAGDSRDGINGGGDYVRWIRTADQARAGAAFFAENCDRVRVSPFLEGVPCSIHGLVLPDGIVVLRPVELATLREPDRGIFFYGGMGTSWDPPAADADAMRSLARELGLHLQHTQGFRGAFGLDGVLTADGFRATELNPRFSGGLTRLANAAPAAQLELVQVNAVIGREVGRPAADIEAVALELLEENRFVDMIGMSTQLRTTETTQIVVAAGDVRLEVAEDPSHSFGTVFAGPSSMGTFVRLMVNEDVIHQGERSAPLCVLLLEFSDRTWKTGFGSVLMAPDVRRG